MSKKIDRIFGLLSLVILTMGIVAYVGYINPLQAASDGPILRSTPFWMPRSSDTYLNNMMSGGPPKDGIPSIDDPKFISARQATQDMLDPGDIVIGYANGEQAKAYPQRILVQHEIVNDQVGGEKVSITYCPLTATAQGFKRGSTTLGVSGRLINSNLVMYDRATDTFYPQILASGIRGPNRGKSLEEFNVIWTTWENWKTQYPNTKVLSTKTGFLRSYDRDPYGQYNPRGGYYKSERTMFPLMKSPERHGSKTMVLGARTSTKSVYVTMDRLRKQEIVQTENFVIVYDKDLDTGYIYSATGSASKIRKAGANHYRYNGDRYHPSKLPFEKHVSIEGFYFAWNAYYPDSETA